MNRAKLSLITIGLLSINTVALAAGKTFTTNDTKTFMVNNDDSTVTLVDVNHDRHYQRVDINLATKVTDSQTGKTYTVTGIGDGTNNLALWVKPPLKITPNIERINDNALPFISYIPTQVDLVMCDSRNLKYIGNNCATTIDTLWLYESMTIGETCATVGHLEFCETPLAIDATKPLFSSIGTINCQQASPPQVSCILSSDPDHFNTIVTVPDNAKESYLNNDYWKQFRNLRTVSEHRQLLAEADARKISVDTPDGNGTALYTINPDNVTVTLIKVTATGSNTPRVDLSLPVIDTRTDKTYTVTEIGDGANSVGATQGVIISPAIKRINANSRLCVRSLPEWNNVEFIGQYAFHSDYPSEELYLAPGTVYAMNALSKGPLHYVRIAHGVHFASVGSAVFGGPARIIRCDSATPPELDGPVYLLSEYYESSNTMLLVPSGSLDSYLNHPEWGKIETIYEFRDDIPLLPFSNYDPSAGEELTITDGEETFTLRVSPDEKFVTVTHYSNKSASNTDIIEFSKPITDPKSGKTYTINTIGLLKDIPTYIKITDNIIRINDSSLQGLCTVSIPSTNNLTYIGSETFFSDLNTVSELYLGDGAVLKSGNNFPHSVVLGNVSSIGETNKCVFNIRNNPTPSWKQVIECTSTVPPVVYGTLYHPLQDDLYNTTTLIVPKGCKEIYSKAYEWNRFANIIEKGMSGITNVTPSDCEMQITPTSGGIIVTAAQPTQINVATLHGLHLLSHRLPAGKTFVNLPAGIHIVTNSTGASAKIMVR